MILHKTLLETIRLENGLDLKLYDDSREIAEALWLVSLTAQMDIPVGSVAIELSGQDSISPDELHALLGDTVVFEKKIERPYISNDNKEALLSEFRDALCDSAEKYFSREDFPRKYVLKCFRDAIQKQPWNKVT